MQINWLDHLIIFKSAWKISTYIHNTRDATMQLIPRSVNDSYLLGFSLIINHAFCMPAN